MKNLGIEKCNEIINLSAKNYNSSRLFRTVEQVRNNYEDLRTATGSTLEEDLLERNAASAFNCQKIFEINALLAILLASQSKYLTFGTKIESRATSALQDLSNRALFPCLHSLI